MGAGASAAEKVQLDKSLASREEPGEKLGAEFEVCVRERAVTRARQASRWLITWRMLAPASLPQSLHDGQ